jgi:hypothetical protein
VAWRCAAQCAENLTDLKLDDIRLAGEDLLHDPTSGYLYEGAPGRPQPDKNPKVVGIMVQGTLRRRERPWSFFSILYKHCLSHKDAMKNMLEKCALALAFFSHASLPSCAVQH